MGMRPRSDRADPRSRRSRELTWCSWMGAAVLALFAAFALHGEAQAQASLAAADEEPAPVTYAGDVAEIINQNCVTCHREGGIGPMELTSYEQVQEWAPLIKMRVVNEDMPPYAYDRHVGIQELEEDWRLSQEQINTIANWVDQGAPMGNPDEIPPPPEMPDPDEWTFAERFGPPDLVIPSTPIDVPAGGNDMWHRPYVPTSLEQDRCIQAVQVKPAGQAKSVVHHANSTFERMTEEGDFERVERVTEYAMGKVGEIIPEDVCRVAPADSWIRWDIHMYPGGIGATAPGTVIEDNVVELGIWLHPEDYEAEYRQDLDLYDLQDGEPVLPPGGTTMTQGFHTFDHPVRLDSFQPHGHLRMVAASLEIFYPETGETETISSISDWSAIWHHSHIFEEDAAPLVPAGAVLILKQWYDNSADNPNNPDPDVWVDAGSRTADEMDHAWIAVTHLDEEGYQELLAEREEEQDEEDDQVALN